jgi:hypothetical protein
MRRAGLVLMVVVATTLGAAPAQAHRKARPSSFQGTCAFHATVRFVPPLGATPQQGSDFARGSGPCTGTFRDRKGRKHRLDGTSVGYVASDSGPSSCAEGAASGDGYLSYRGSRLRFSLTEVRAGAAATLHFDGRRSGSANGDARVSPDTDPAAVVQQCLGSGLGESTVDIDFATTPAISG